MECFRNDDCCGGTTLECFQCNRRVCIYHLSEHTKYMKEMYICTLCVGKLVDKAYEDKWKIQNSFMKLFCKTINVNKLKDLPDFVREP